MIINRKFVRQLAGYLGGLIPHTEIKFATQLSNISDAKLTGSGFEGLQAHDVLLPSTVGKTSRVNSEGSYIIHRDQPKERRLVGRREWTREEWAGRGQTNTITEEVDIYRECYPRTFIPPPGVELTVVEHDGQLFAVSPTCIWQQTSNLEVIHTLNLMLELFGETEVRHGDLTSFLPPHTRRVNWVLLPPGNGMAGITAHVQGLINRTAPSFRAPIMSRLTYLASRNPADVYLGQGGFHAYVAYVFPGTGMTVLESVMPANATYIFQGNWQAVSHLTKTEILAGHHHHDRIFHDATWENRLARYAR